jgi:hypothetical protein
MRLTGGSNRTAMTARKSSSSRLESWSHVIPCQWSCLPSRLRHYGDVTPATGCDLILGRIGRRVSMHWFAGVLQSLCSPSKWRA